MPGLDPVIHSYEAKFDEMKLRAGAKPDVLEKQISEAKARMAPISYSLDTAWQLRLQSFRDTVVNDPTRGAVEGPDKALLKALDALASTGIEERLTKWLIEADPFKEKYDPEAITEIGGKLLKSLEGSFEIAGNRTDMQQLQPDLLALTDVVRTRMTRLNGGDRPNSEAVSVPHQMYVELQGAFARPIEVVRNRVRAEATSRGDDPEEADSDWDDGSRAVTAKIGTSYKRNPGFVWDVACERRLPEANTPLRSVEYEMKKLFGQRPFRQQILDFYAAVDATPDAANYVMRIRDAAWNVQETIQYYFDSMAKIWGNGTSDVRTELEQTLSAVSTWMVKEVNFVVTSRLAKGQ